MELWLGTLEVEYEVLSIRIMGDMVLHNPFHLSVAKEYSKTSSSNSSETR